MNWRRSARRTVATVILAAGTVSASAAVQYASPSDLTAGSAVGSSFSRLAFSTVPADGNYVGTTTITPMAQTGSALGDVYTTGTRFVPLSASGGLWSVTTCCDIAMRVDFDVPVLFASVQFIPDDTDTGVFQAYGVSGALLNEQVARQNTPFELSFTASGQPVRYILASFGDTGYLGRVGYDFVGVPAPAVLPLLLLGFALMLPAARLRRHLG